MFYRDGGGGLVSATVNSRSTFAIGDQHVLFPAGPFVSSNRHRQYDLTPDHRRFVFVRFVGGQAAPGETTLIMVDHWLSDLGLAEQRRP